ncbi:MAG TPA: DedA family protein [Salinarimonas sp.]|jgi:membrane protein DedA with SNARE-associated domain|nr:DedA family protein [Salinarimonas sp.]
MDLSGLTDAVLAFVRENHAYAPFIVAAFAFCESLAVLSLLVPATVILIGIGALIGATGIDFWPIWLGAVVGAFAGDTVSYWVGRYFKDGALTMWPLSRHPQMVERGRSFFHRWGAWGVFVGRFFGPLRAVVPLIAGILVMPHFLFQMVNASSAMAWAFVMLAPGAGLMQAIF